MKIDFVKFVEKYLEYVSKEYRVQQIVVQQALGVKTQQDLAQVTENIMMRFSLRYLAYQKLQAIEQQGK